MAEKADAIVRRKNPVPPGLQKVLCRLAKLALHNSPCCFYECFATALESDIDWRTLLDLQLAPYLQKTPQFRGDAVDISGESASVKTTSQHELTVQRHELGDAELCNLQSADKCQELATSEQLVSTSDEIHTYQCEPRVSSVLDNIGHDAAITDNLSEQKHNLIPDTCDIDLSHSLLASSNDNAFNDQLGLNGLGQIEGSQSVSETSRDQACDENSNMQEVTMTVSKCTDINDMTQVNTYEKFIKDDTDCSAVETALLEIESIDQDATLNKDGFASEQSFKNDCETVNLLDSWSASESGGERCYKDADSSTDAHSSTAHDQCLAEITMSASEVPEVDFMCHTTAVSCDSLPQQTSSCMTKEPEVHYISSSLDCENSKFVDIPVQSIAQHVQLMLDSNEMDAVCSNFEQITQDQQSSFDVAEHMTKELSSAVEFQQTSTAGIHSSLGVMELRDDVELTEVDNGKTGTEHNRDSSETTCDMNEYFDSFENIKSLSNDTQCPIDGICTSLDGMEIHDDMELISVDNETTDRQHDIVDTKTICDMKAINSFCSDTGSDTYDDMNAQLEFLQLIPDSLEKSNTASTSHNAEQLATLSRDDRAVEVAQHNAEITGNCDSWNLDNNHAELVQSPDNGVEVMPAPEYMLHCTNTAPENSESDLVLTATEEVCDSIEEPDTADEKGRTSAEFVSASDSVQSVTDMQDVDTVVSLEAIHKVTASDVLMRLIDLSAYSNTPETAEKEEDKGNIVPESTASADLEFCINDGFSENSTMEHHADLLFLNNEETSSTVCHANEDFPLSLNEQRGKQLELFTVDSASLQTRRLELENLTLTVTCFIPEESEELLADEDVLEDVNESEHLMDPSMSSSRKLNGSDPAISGSDNKLPKHRSSEFMLSYLMPIDETAEFTDDGNTDTDDLVPNKSHLLQPDDSPSNMKMKTESSNDNELKTVFNINASPTVENAYHLCHELSERSHCDNDAVTGGIEESQLDSSLSNVDDFGAVENPLQTKNGNERDIQTLWFSSNQENTVAQMLGVSRYFPEDSADSTAHNVTNVTQTSHLLDGNNEHVTTAERATLTMNLPLEVSDKDHARNRYDMSKLLAANATTQSSSTYSFPEDSILDLGNEHFRDINALKQPGTGNVLEHLDNKHDTQNTKTVGLDMETFSSNETVLSENSAVVNAAELKHNDEPCKQSTGLLLCERPVLQANDIHTTLDAILQGRIQTYDTAGNKQPTTVEEHPLSQIAANDTDASHSIATVLRNSSPAVVEASMDLEEPAADAFTDFESTLEHLHTANCTDHMD